MAIDEMAGGPQENVAIGSVGECGQPHEWDVRVDTLAEAAMCVWVFCIIFLKTMWKLDVLKIRSVAEYLTLWLYG